MYVARPRDVEQSVPRYEIEDIEPEYRPQDNAQILALGRRSLPERYDFRSALHSGSRNPPRFQVYDGQADIVPRVDNQRQSEVYRGSGVSSRIDDLNDWYQVDYGTQAKRLWRSNSWQRTCRFQ
jgi:hypothetical protein